MSPGGACETDAMGEHSHSTSTPDIADSVTTQIKDRITSYFDACGTGNADAISEHFTDDAVVYDSNHAPVEGAATIGQFWSRIAAKWQGAAWHVERLVTDGDTAAIEWVMTGTTAAHAGAEGTAFAVRGSEHYEFSAHERLIAEIRQYWTFDPRQPSSELVSYPYGEPGRLGS